MFSFLSGGNMYILKKISITLKNVEFPMTELKSSHFLCYTHIMLLMLLLVPFFFFLVLFPQLPKLHTHNVAM